MTWTVEFSDEARIDIQLHFAHLEKSQRAFGYGPQDARSLARSATLKMFDLAESLADMPGVGTGHPELLEGIRHVALQRCIFWFRPDHSTQTIQIFAIFRAGQDHYVHILNRLTEKGEAD